MSTTGRSDAPAAAGGADAERSATDLAAVRLQQARTLHGSVRNSCIAVAVLVVYIAVLHLAHGDVTGAIRWTLGASVMVAVTWAFSRSHRVIDEQNYQRYLTRHVLVSCTTGLVWSALAIAQLDASSLFSLFIGLTIPTSITLGGMFPSSAYRATYIGLLTCAVLPVLFYWLFEVPGPSRYVGFGLFAFYLFGLLVSARHELNTRDALLTRQTRRLNEQLQRQTALLEQADREKSRFLLSSIHDVAQPLQAQGYFIHALRSRLATPEQLELLDRIEASWRSQSELMRGISDMARLDDAQTDVARRPVDVAPVVRAAVDEFTRDAERAGVTLQATLEPTPADTDPALLARILRNLLSNAIKFSDAGDTVEVHCGSGPDGPLLVVRDTGPGIEAADRERIFEEFERLPGAEAQDGLGVGLAIVRQLVELLGAELELTSAVGEGSTFTLRLPPASIGALATTPAERDLDSSPVVVLVDDEADIRDAMAELLGQWGCRVHVAGSAAQAIELVVRSDQTPDLLVVDGRLGNGEQGANVIDALRDEVNAAVPALLMSGNLLDLPMPEDVLHTTVLAKPVDPGTLRSHLTQRERSA